MVLQGAPLPPPGTFKEVLFLEAAQRAKMERFAFARFLSRLVAISSPEPGVAKSVGLALAEYGEELFQFRYNSRYEPVAHRYLKEHLNVEQAQRQILDKVAAMTVTDEEMERINGGRHA